MANEKGPPGRVAERRTHPRYVFTADAEIAGPETGARICREERRGILSLDAKPEAGIVAETGLGFVLLRANQTEGYVLGAGKFVHLIGLNRSRLLVSTTLCEQKFRHCAMGCFRLVRP